ncbi:Uncharacterised protein [Actinomyces howellii]|uniref:Uncharacterized protein n=1 Tax=Actinomyces howellii TaxID=52771 RepID=A0A3S4RY96_9ACTO|nr:Uncharacterised protein [Actinomyces howellii]
MSGVTIKWNAAELRNLERQVKGRGHDAVPPHTSIEH